MRRRAFIKLLGGAAASVAWPRRLGAQQAVPVVGFLRSTPPAPFQNLVTAFRQGLKEAGFVEGQNVAI
ncbi:MAG: ABC transporter substrate-binding protein, partial [Xanthobacteraceae bacterium]